MASFLHSVTRFARPKTFFYLMSLRTGAELITMSILVNKISGFFGILALFTGFELNSLQLSMYIYSILAVVLTAYLAPHIRTQSPLQCLALAWFYALDSVVNALYTAIFGFSWFVVLAMQKSGGDTSKAPGGGTIDDTAGFTNPKHNVSKVEIIATPAPGVSTGQDAVAIGAGSNGATIGSALFQSGSMASISVIVGLWALRVYFVFIVMAYARLVLRQYIANSSASSYNLYAHGDSKHAENPFSDGRPEGTGWKGRLGRAMVAFPRDYWLGAEDDGEWMRGMGGKFRRNLNVEPAGVFERERRRRSGTGPPKPAVPLQDLAPK